MAPKCLLPTFFFGFFSSVGLSNTQSAKTLRSLVYDTDYNGINHIELRFIGIS